MKSSLDLRGFQRLPPAMLVAYLLVSCSSGGQGVSMPPPSPSLSPAQQTAEQNPDCQKISPFYFEIGDANGVITSASIGVAAPAAATPMSIASATKWLFGAYVAEVRSGVLSPTDLKELTMESGYVSMSSLALCDPNASVSSCFATPPNNTFTAASLGRFDYSSGHFQKWGSDDSTLGPMRVLQLTAEFQRVLGPDTPMVFSSPTLASGAVMSASGYAGFLRRILRGDLQINALLGSNSVCTRASSAPRCGAVYSPLYPLAWHYSIGHWVEDDLANGDDGSFSSAGALGFYPWINSSKTHYGIVARQELTPADIPSAPMDSIVCGRAIRTAHVTGVVQ